MKTSGTLINDSCVHDFDIAISMISLDGDRPAKLSTFGSILISPEACKEANDITRVCIQIMTQKGKLVTVHSESFSSISERTRVADVSAKAPAAASRARTSASRRTASAATSLSRTSLATT